MIGYLRAFGISLLALYVAADVKSYPVNNATSNVKMCGYEATCSAGGYTGACVSISSGCCGGGTVTSGLCPGDSDIRCCTAPSCSTPQGSGQCMSTGECAGRGFSVPGYCAGPSDLQCCVGGSPSGCILGEQMGCDDQVARGLANQIIGMLQSMGYSFKSLDTNWIHCNGGCNMFLQSSAADSLANAAAAINDYITINSAFRSSAEQYLLYRWYQKGMCDITLAAAPGSSNHEGGRAIDTSYYNYWLGPLGNYGWVHSYPSSDPVHFDFGGAADIASQNLLAFQKLWNQHNPGNKLDEDGIYGPMTEDALYHSPCNGW